MLRSKHPILPGVIATLLLAAPLVAHPARASVLPVGTPPVSLPRKPQTLDERRGARAGALRSSPRHVLAGRRRPAGNPPTSVAFFDDAGVWHQTGLASWYGGTRWQGHATASGSRFDQNGLTAAHATLPLGSKVRVSLVGTDRSIVVTVNDRPGTRHIVIDLSQGAARALGMLDRGVAKVALSTP